MANLVDGLMRAAEMAREMEDQLYCTSSAYLSRGDWDRAHQATLVATAYRGFAARLEEEAARETTGVYLVVDVDDADWVATK